jgi:mono/diheme cytochrome c family protein
MSQTRSQKTAVPAQCAGVAAIAALCALTSVLALAQPGPAAGDPERGEQLYTETYKCFACHGFDAQTGLRRLLPMNFGEQAFITFVQNSPLPQMPVYADVPGRDLADVYAYIRTIPIDAPEIDQIPVLKDILDESLEALSN